MYSKFTRDVQIYKIKKIKNPELSITKYPGFQSYFFPI